MSIRIRIVIATLLLTTVGLVCAGFFTYRMVEAFLVDRLDEQLVRERGRVFIQGQAPKTFQTETPTGSMPILPVSNGAYGEIRSATGVILGTYPVGEGESVPELPLTISGNEGWFTVDSSNGGPEFRVNFAPLGDSGDVVIYALPLSDVDATLTRLVWIELGVFGAVLLVMGVLVYGVVRVSLRPLSEVVGTADAIARGDLSRRAPDANPRSEVGRLSAAFNAMIGAIESSFGRQRAAEQRLRDFVADASHELRTPLTPMQGYAEMLESSSLSEVDRRFAAARISEASTRMSRLVNDMLLLARMDETSNLNRAPVDLTELALGAIADARMAEPGREIELVASQSVTTIGDRDYLARAIANLLTNVRVHTPADAPASIHVFNQDGRAIVEIRDSGPGIPAELQAHLFDRFYRVEKSRSRAEGGAGLGLSIVASIAEAHGGSISVSSLQPHGTAFRLSLPLEHTVLLPRPTLPAYPRAAELPLPMFGSPG